MDSPGVRLVHARQVLIRKLSSGANQLSLKTGETNWSSISLAETSTTLTSWALLVWKALQELGYDSHSIFRQVGMDPAKLGDGNARYKLEDMTKLWSLAVEETRNPCFGIEAGKRWAPTTFHALGFAWLASHTLRDALQRLVRYSRIVNNTLITTLEEHGLHLHLIFDTNEVESDIHYAARDAALVAVIIMCRMLCGDKFSPVEVHTRREPSLCREVLEQFVGAPILFNSDRNATVFNRMQSEQRVATGNSELAKVNEELAMKYLVSLERASSVMQVKAQLVAMLPEGQVSESAVAERLNMSLRTLQRKLHAEQTSFSEIYNSIRREMANEYIQDSQMSMTEIAYLLGFSEQANFSRAFRRWYGTSPSEARQHLLTQGFA